MAHELRRLTLAIYEKAGRHAESRGMILADTKFEFGMTQDGIVLADEVLTPDSSRFWEASVWKPGGAQPSFDKQFVRDYLESIHWNKQAPAPSLPEDVVERTLQKYLEAFRRLTGRELDATGLNDERIDAGRLDHRGGGGGGGAGWHCAGILSFRIFAGWADRGAGAGGMELLAAGGGTEATDSFGRGCERSRLSW